MPSNSLSERRGLLRRPIVCRKGPPPSPPTPTPTIDCYLHPTAYTAFMGEDVALDLWCFNSDYGPMQNVAAAYFATGGTITGPNPITNDLPSPGNWAAPFTPGFYDLKAVYTWPDTTTCIDIRTYQVVMVPPP
ncbi:hypothetical protein LCGC14_1345710 [marine sediment metagenome]|uniref:Uncharacterized protein n=1 Tax=marine sediment metagenome TaxID=412755 RepID=A0A0F9KD23_9ZZZZ